MSAVNSQLGLTGNPASRVMQMTSKLSRGRGTAAASRAALRHHPLALACAAALALGAFALPALATQTTVNATWVDGTGNWSDPSNWACVAPNNPLGNCIPADGNGQFFDTTIGAPANDTITFDAGPTTIDSLKVGVGTGVNLQDVGGSDLTVGDSGSTSSTSGTLTVTDGSVLYWDNSGLTVGSGSTGKITNNGTVIISGSDLTVNGNVAANNGSLGITNSGDARITGDLVSTGTITVEGVASTLLANKVTTSGSLVIGAESFLGTAANPLKTFTISGGTAQVIGQLNADRIVQTGGTITTVNGGTVTGSLVSEGGTTNVQGQTVTLTAPPGEGSTVVPVKGQVVGSAKATINVNGDLATSSTGEVELDGASTLAVSGKATNDGLIKLDPTASPQAVGNKMTTGSDLVNTPTGQVALGAGSEVEVGGNLANSGVLTAGGCPKKNCVLPTALDVHGALVNSGTMELVPVQSQQQRGTTLRTKGSASNSGTVSIGKGDAVDIGGLTPTPDPNLSYAQSAGSTQVDGELSAPIVDISGGKLRGRGRLDPSLTIIDQGATLSPGDADGGIGTFTVVGPLDLYGSLDIGIDGIGNFDVLDVTGDATFGGHSFFSFALDDDTSQSAGDAFQFFNANSFLDLADLGSHSFGCSGLESGLECMLDMQSDGDGFLKLESASPHGVPEPGSLGMLGLGLGLLGLFARFGYRSVKKSADA